MNNFYDTSCVERDLKSKEGISDEIKRNRLSEGYAEKYKDDAQRGQKIAAECDRAAARKEEDNSEETLTFHPHSLERRSGIAIA